MNTTKFLNKIKQNQNNNKLFINNIIDGLTKVMNRLNSTDTVHSVELNQSVFKNTRIHVHNINKLKQGVKVGTDIYLLTVDNGVFFIDSDGSYLNGWLLKSFVKKDKIAPEDIDKQFTTMGDYVSLGRLCSIRSSSDVIYKETIKRLVNMNSYLEAPEGYIGHVVIPTIGEIILDTTEERIGEVWLT